MSRDSRAPLFEAVLRFILGAAFCISGRDVMRDMSVSGDVMAIDQQKFLNWINMAKPFGVAFLALVGGYTSFAIGQVQLKNRLDTIDTYGSSAFVEYRKESETDRNRLRDDLGELKGDVKAILARLSSRNNDR